MMKVPFRTCWTIRMYLNRRIPILNLKCLWCIGTFINPWARNKTAIHSTRTVEFIRRDVRLLCLSSPLYIGRGGYFIACSLAAYPLVTTYLRCLVLQVSYHADDVSSIWKQQKKKNVAINTREVFLCLLIHLFSFVVIFVSATNRMQEMLFNILLQQCDMLSL
jgi:hypothetical protein